MTNKYIDLNKLANNAVIQSTKTHRHYIILGKISDERIGVWNIHYKQTGWLRLRSSHYILSPLNNLGKLKNIYLKLFYGIAMDEIMRGDYGDYVKAGDIIVLYWGYLKVTDFYYIISQTQTDITLCKIHPYYHKTEKITNINLQSILNSQSPKVTLLESLNNITHVNLYMNLFYNENI
jgi:hypothetical protein